MLCFLRDEMASSTHPFNSHTLNGVPTTPTPDHRLELPLPPPDSNHTPHRATHTRHSDESLIPSQRAAFIWRTSVDHYMCYSFISYPLAAPHPAEKPLRVP